MSDAMAIAGRSAPAVTTRLPGQGSGISAHARLLYRSMLQGGPMSAAGVNELLTESGGAAALDQLIHLGLVRRTQTGLVAVPRAQVIDELLSEQVQVLQRAMDEVLSRQRRIRTLLEAGPELEGDSGERIHTVPLHSAGDNSMYTLPSRATHELMALHPGGQFSAEVLDQSLARAEESLNAGVRLRVVHQSAMLGHRGMVGYLQTLEDLGAWVRLRDNLPFRLLMIDRDAAVCASPSGQQGEDTFVIRGQRVIGLLERVFETTWVDSTPLRTALSQRRRALQPGPEHVGEPLPAAGSSGPYGPSGAADEPAEPHGALDDATLAQRYARLTEQQQLILRCLAEGETDRMIARRAGVTPRTVSRRIAEIYQELQVESRFQAGVVAHRLGLV